MLSYGEQALDRAEKFEPGSLHWPDGGIVLNEQHNRQAPIMRFTPEVVGTEVRIDAPLPDTQRGRDAATMVKNGTFTGLSIEFRSEAEGRSAGTRMIRRASLSAAALVDSPSHKSIRGSSEARPDGGRKDMALTLTQAQLSAAIRLGDSTEETAEATRLLAYVTAAISTHLADAYEDRAGSRS